MRHSAWSFLVFFLTLTAVYCGNPDGYHHGRHQHHGGHRRQRSTQVVGNGIRVHHESADGSAVSTSSSSAFTTTSDDSDDPENLVGSTYEIIPGKTVYHTLPGGGISATATSSARLNLNKLVTTTAAVQPAPVLLERVIDAPEPVLLGKVIPPVPFVRPLGELPIPPNRFGFEVPPRIDGEYALPNCGCLQRGRCIGEVRAYTQHVVQFTDIVCGFEFETCCFDGPYPGVHDAFANVAACVPTELCLRPYGVLPTDVRDFGAIAPCPGQGVVRCIAVDSVGLLEFRAALAAIEASSVSSEFHQEYHVNPIHLAVPLLTKGSKSSNIVAIADATASVQFAGLTGEKGVVQPPQTIVIKSPPVAVPVPSNYHDHDHQPTPNVFVIQVPAYQPPAAVPVAQCKQCNEVVEKTPPGPITVPEPPVAVAPPAVAPFAQLAVQPGFGYYRSPYVGGLYPGFGYGAGLGFHKRFHLSKGFGFGFGK